MKKVLIFGGLGFVGLVVVVFGLFFLPLIIHSVHPRAFCQPMNPAELEEAIRGGFDVNAGCCNERMMEECQFAKPNCNALIYAVETGRTDTVQALLDHGADVNARWEMGDALETAARLGKSDMIVPLLSHGAQSLNWAVRLAAHEGYTDIAAQIFGKVTEAQLPESCKEALCGLVSDLAHDPRQASSPTLAQQRELFVQFVQACPDSNILCEPWRLLSSIARDDENAPLVEALLKKGADLETKERDGRTVRAFLMSFADYRSRPKIRALIEGH